MKLKAKRYMNVRNSVLKVTHDKQLEDLLRVQEPQKGRRDGRQIEP